VRRSVGKRKREKKIDGGGKKKRKCTRSNLKKCFPPKTAVRPHILWE